MTRPAVLESPTAPDWTSQAFAALEAAALAGHPCDARSLIAHGLPKPPVACMWGALFAEASKARIIRKVTGPRRSWLASA
ncbi:hypothetical protein [Pseudarthrobacter cellobiosi]|uniref:hypothetical protein n=1 Tax=Pseudarthrobacter cellobiosi TaxID=2953654 RepID=UPI00208FDC7B|nr:hypothetical protein [Pseudarthrobacter sp. HLT1-5]MCO4257349.1 hypothetical protein [Pseudarthrobacter sp. HLT1-5]